MFELNRKKGTATKLRARFPKVHRKAELEITFQRTLESGALPLTLDT